MRLTWKDAGATILTGAVVALYVAFQQGVDLPLVSGPRALASAMLVLGITACALGGGGTPAGASGALARVGGALGAVAGVAALATVITGSEAMLALLVTATVSLWVLATARHLFASVSGGAGSDGGPGGQMEREKEEQYRR
jgi:hypothetical protein